MQVRKGVWAVALAGSMTAGAFGAWFFAPSAGSAATSSTGATRSHSNEDATHEKGESAQREADENAGKAGFGGHGQETVVTGATADKIKAAALAAVPGTVDKTEQRADGSYEAEITKSDGSEVHVSLDKNFVVTTTNGRGNHDGQREGDATGG
jgi:hypothetical protein